MTEIIKEIKAVREIQKKAKEQNLSIGFVPTMGNLHAGHISLLNRARAENDLVILSVFINPTQFNTPQDFVKYPQTLENDLALAKQQQVNYLFTPTKEILYPDQYRFQLTETQLSKKLEGQYRPGHFEGVLTVVMKLLQIVHPDRAYFGEKDYQQLTLISEMAHAFFLETEIIGCPTVREKTGLAFSSRNTLLNAKQLSKAPQFHQLLASDNSCETITALLHEQGFKVDYIQDHEGRRYGAVFLDDIRLIDNIQLKEEI